ncbi:hypothetical protein GE09DRAFT_1064582 [Coniochaeta sp. 2T2.1]|nr:hypothetical protein GE09DRAFT_1064582 [Coniochaeta sp. 2T2.1]
MKTSTKASTLAGLLCGLASLGAATSCDPGKEYKGGDLLSMDPAYEPIMMSQLEYWSKNGNANDMVPSRESIEKSFFKCEGEMQLDLMHWCACGIADTVDATTGMKDGEVNASGFVEPLNR